MKWYLAKIVYRIICGDGNHTAQFDEQLRLIEAEDDMHAFQKARITGDQEEVPPFCKLIIENPPPLRKGHSRSGNSCAL